MIVSLLTIGFHYSEILDLPEDDAYGMIQAYNAMNDPDATKTRKYKVRRKK